MHARRALLYMPGDDRHKIEKALTLGVDCICMDLEDGVAFGRKPAARRTVTAALDELEFGRAERLVRINAAGSGLEADDLAAVLSHHPDGIVLPKVETPEDVAAAADLLAAAGAPPGLPLWLTVETPRGVLAAPALAGAHPRVAGLVAGTSDLAKELHARHVPSREPLLFSLSAIVLAARAHGLAALDGVHLALDDAPGFEAACRQGRDLGFDGKTLIHPRTIEAANRLFAPDPEEVAAARRLLACWQEACEAGRGVVVLDGRLVEELHALEAQRLLSRADAIAARRNG